METLKPPNLRTVDVARIVGCSVQQVRNLERDGVLPPTSRTKSGYRVYRSIHVRCALAYKHLSVGVGPVDAKHLLRTAQASTSRALALLDAAHARIHREREDLALAKEIAVAIAVEPVHDVRPADAMTVSELADALGVRTSTLRHWDAEGLVTPDRVAPRRHRLYSPGQVRDARIVHQLRRAGYRVPTLRIVMHDLPRTHRTDEIEAALIVRGTGLDAASRALLDAAAELRSVLTPVRIVRFSRPETPR